MSIYGVELAIITADKPRPDVAASYNVDEHCGFDYRLPVEISARCSEALTFSDVESGVLLQSCPKDSNLPVQSDVMAAIQKQLNGCEVLAANRARVAGGKVTFLASNPWVLIHSHGASGGITRCTIRPIEHDGTITGQLQLVGGATYSNRVLATVGAAIEPVWRALLHADGDLLLKWSPVSTPRAKSRFPSFEVAKADLADRLLVRESAFVAPFILEPGRALELSKSRASRSWSGKADVHASVCRDSMLVIPSINGASLLEAMLPTLDMPLEKVWVIDQGSTDNTVQVCAKYGVQILQAGSPRTYTQCCNIGTSLAAEQSTKFLYISNNDVRLVTNVCHELMDEMLADPGLGIIAPSQRILDPANGIDATAYRVSWNLESLTFTHDFNAPEKLLSRIESDFCELTFALLNVEAVVKVGSFDDDYGFYHEDADLCFRLREAGYSAAYCPTSQIIHYSSSTFSRDLSAQKASYLANSKAVFARKHLGFGVRHADHASNEATSWNIINRYLHPYLRSNGLVQSVRPELIFSHPGALPLDYLFTVWETDKVPAAWAAHATDYKLVCAPSHWNVETLTRGGFNNVLYVPLGVETDVYHPDGVADRSFHEPTYLWFGRNQLRKGLDVMLSAWAIFRQASPKARLIVMGQGVLTGSVGYTSDYRRHGNFVHLDIPEQGVHYRETITPLADRDVAAIYRGVDYLVCTSRSEGFGFSIVEAMACGVTPIFPDYGAGSDMVYAGALTFGGRVVPADYTDKGFEDVGNWWEPDESSILSALYASAADDRSGIAAGKKIARNLVRKAYTWRNTCTALRRGLVRIQQQLDVDASVRHLEEVSSSMLDIATSIEKELAIRTRNPAISLGDVDVTEIPDEFDGDYYYVTNPDVARAGLDSWTHYRETGWLEGREPSERVKTHHLLNANAGVRRVLLKSTEGRLWHIADVSRDLSGTPTRPLPLSSQLPDEPVREGVLFVGYVEAGLGLGESLRNLINAVVDKVATHIYPFNELVADRFSGRFREESYDLQHAYEINVFQVAADQLPAAMRELGRHRIESSYNIFRTYWELPQAFDGWRKALQSVDELWAPTAFVAEAFRHVYDGPINIVPTVVDVDVALDLRAPDFGLDDETFYFLFSFDHTSSSFRKNPLAVVHAFQQAFPDTPGVGLLIKSVGPQRLNTRLRADLETLASTDPRIVIMDRKLTRVEMVNLINISDCYVSLHRSEGFGMGMAEALSLAKSVIGTNFGGNTDFLSEATGYPVAFELRALKDGEYPYADGQSWAEPSISAAAACMRAVYDDRPEAQRRAAAGCALIREAFGSNVVGELVADLIGAITRNLSSRGRAEI